MSGFQSKLFSLLVVVFDATHRLLVLTRFGVLASTQLQVSVVVTHIIEGRHRVTICCPGTRSVTKIIFSAKSKTDVLTWLNNASIIITRRSRARSVTISTSVLVLVQSVLSFTQGTVNKQRN